jgi:hypothetical protein
MAGRLGCAALLPAAIAIGFAIGGCGTSGSSSSPSSTTSSSIYSSAAVTASGAATGTGTGTTPAATAHLLATKGYGTYERCQGQCTGSVPAALRRPLSLPSGTGGPCPVTLNADGPVSPSGDGNDGAARVLGSAWLSVGVTWTAAASYSGPILIRGGRIDAPGALGFGTGAVPYDELQLLDAGLGAPAHGAAREWLTDTRVGSAGCYAYQVDGTTFSEKIVFRAVA